ncbi:MAG TPA: ABC transporter substrate-binding protein [Burkholderiaceae bacterium]|nr:ABC transporter substrate-binding protein [Burkholderiaceae bacterium]
MSRSRLAGLFAGVIGGVIGAAITAAIVPAWAQSSAPAKSVTVRIGWQPLAGGSAAMAMVMQREQLFEKQAARFGYKLVTDWKTMAAGPPSNEAMIAGQLDIDMHLAALPTATRIAVGIPAVPIAVVGSNIANAIMVRPGSPINEVADLAGKRIGLPVGTSAHYVLASVVQAHFGKSIEEAGIRIVNMPVTEGVKVPDGIDASAVWVPLRFIGPHLGISQLLVDANGWTGRGHARPQTRLKEVEKAWAYPEGYNTDRLYAFARTGFLADHPDVVLAFILAHMEAQQRVLSDFEGTAALANQAWKQDDIIAKTTLQTYAETSGVRKVPFVLEWDVATILKASEFLAATKARDRPLTWEQLKTAFTASAELQKRAWGMGPYKPSLEEMTKGFAGKTDLYGPIHINGGEPVWTWAQRPDWGQRVLAKSK